MNKVIVVLGPTGVGKTKMSIELAKRFNGEVINADSTQVYRGLDIATAKVTKDEKENIPHHLFDIMDVNNDYTVYDYQKDARKKIDDLLKKGVTPILVGGTGLYIKACLYNYEFKDQKFKSDYKDISNDDLYKKLLKIDPLTKIHINNRKRVERALDYYYQTGNIIGSNKSDEILYDTIFIGLTTTREVLYDRINRRVDVMLDMGLLDEARRIYDSNIRTKAIITPIGYKELFPYFDNTSSLEECINIIKQNSRRYAKRQYTWFNNQLNVKWFDVDFSNFDKTVNEVFKYIKKETNY